MRQEIMFKEFLDNKNYPFFCHKKICQSPKNCIFLKGKPVILVKKYNFFLCFVSVKIRLQIMFNNVLERKETFIGPKKFNL